MKEYKCIPLSYIPRVNYWSLQEPCEPGPLTANLVRVSEIYYVVRF